jgi:hypothetical protein
LKRVLWLFWDGAFDDWPGSGGPELLESRVRSKKMSKQNFNLVESEFLERAFVPGELDSSAEDGASSRILFHTVRIVEKLFVASIQRLAEELSCAVARLQVIEVIYCNAAV